MAEVFLAKSMLGDRDHELLALKRTLSQYSGEEEFVSMFADEARIASGLKHANICQIYDHGQLADQRYIVMEFIHGKDLKIIAHRAGQRDERIPHHILCAIFVKIAEALHFAHNKCNDEGEPEHIVHRDISPQNILISYDGIPKLIDFGIAKAKDRLAKTQAGVVKGKFAYMSPEQAIGAEVDWRSDIFALGVVFYELLTGELPFQGGSDFSTLKKIAKADYDKPADDLPPRLLTVLDRSLTRSADERYTSAQEMADDLERFLDEDGRNVEPSAISSYMRKLVSRRLHPRDGPHPQIHRDRTAETTDHRSPTSRTSSTTRIRGELTSAEEKVLEAAEDTEDGLETRVNVSTDLAAGFDADDEPTGLAELLEPEDLDEISDAVSAIEELDPLDTTDASDASESLAALDALEADEEGEDVTLVGDEFDEATVSIPAGGFSFHESTDETPFEETGEHSIERPAAKLDPEKDKPTRDLSEAAGKATADDDRDEEISIELDGDFEETTMDLEPADGDLATDAAEQAKETSKPKRRPTSKPTRRATTGSARRGTGTERRQTGRPRTQGRRRSSTGRRPGLLTGGEAVTLVITAVIGAVFVLGTYYVTHFGVPPFASGLKPAIEAVTGELPPHASELPEKPPDAG